MGARLYRRRRFFGRWFGGAGTLLRNATHTANRRRENGGTDDHNGNDNDTHIDIMTSPELAAQREAARHNKGSRKVISENSAHDNSITTKRCNTIANIQRPPPSQPRRRIKPQP